MKMKLMNLLCKVAKFTTKINDKFLNYLITELSFEIVKEEQKQGKEYSKVIFKK